MVWVPLEGRLTPGLKRVALTIEVLAFGWAEPNAARRAK